MLISVFFLIPFISIQAALSQGIDDEIVEAHQLNAFLFERNRQRDTLICDTQNAKQVRELIPDRRYHIRGQVQYMGSFNGTYAYDALIKDNEIILSTKIFLRNVKKETIQHTESDFLEASRKIKWAEDYWNAEAPAELNIRFKFELVETKDLAYFSPALVRKRTRGPYYAGWSVFWPKIVIAHEIGHMFGLDDEYENNFAGASTDLCSHDSLMCAHKEKSHLKDYHFKIILDRLNCFK